MKEEWKLMLEGHYEVSNFGNVRRAKSAKGAKVGRYLGTNVRRGPAFYRRFSAWVRGAKKDVYVHRLVAEAFIGPCPVGHQVHHKDGNGLNNHITNLKYVTDAENKRESFRRRIFPDGIPSVVDRRFNPEDVKAMRLLAGAGFIKSYIGKLFNTHPNYVAKIIKRERWKHVI